MHETQIWPPTRLNYAARAMGYRASIYGKALSRWVCPRQHPRMHV